MATETRDWLRNDLALAWSKLDYPEHCLAEVQKIQSDANYDSVSAALKKAVGFNKQLCEKARNARPDIETFIKSVEGHYGKSDEGELKILKNGRDTAYAEAYVIYGFGHNESSFSGIVRYDDGTLAVRDAKDGCEVRISFKKGTANIEPNYLCGRSPRADYHGPPRALTKQEIQEMQKRLETQIKPDTVFD
jgi:hypothetical protein